MERPQHQSRLHPSPNQPRNPLAHLATGLDCECAADDVLWAVAMVGEEVRDARG